MVVFLLRKFFFIVLIVFVACGCSRRETRDSKWREENGKLKILTTIAMIDNLVAEIGGENIDSMPLIRGELDPHSYELVKGDDEKFARADIIFYNGLGLEHGFSLRQNLVNNPRAIAVSDPILNNDPKLILTVDGEYDPHIWMDIALWMQTIEPMIEALSAKDPAHADTYRQRGEALLSKMQESDLRLFTLLQAVPQEKRYLVTSHDAFHYFTRHYLAEPGEENWHSRCKAPEGLAPEAQMSMCDVMAIVEHIESFKISVLFPESNVSKDSLKKIVDACKEKGFNIRLCQEDLYGDSMGAAASYIDMISHNVEIIAQELKHE